MSELLTRKNKDTGETITFQWDGPKPPTGDQIDEIARQRLDAKIEAQRKMSSNEPGIIDKVLASRPFDAFRGAAEAAGFNQPWHPIDAAAQVGAGVKQAFTGEGPEQHPRIAGAVKAVKGAMGVVGPPLTAAGYAIAPIPTAAAMIGGNLAGRGAAALTPEDYSPEVKEAIQTGAGLAAGGLIGGGVARAMRPSAPISEGGAPGVEVLPPKPPGNFRATPPDFNESMIMDMGPRKLPQGPPEAPGPVSRPMGPAPQKVLPPGGDIIPPPVDWRGARPPQDLTSTKVAPLSPSEVSTVSPTEGPSPKVENRAVQPPVQPSPQPPAIIPPIPPQITPPAPQVAPQPPAQAQVPPASNIAAAAMRKAYNLPEVPAAPPQVAPAPPLPQVTAPPAPAPVPPPQLPPVPSLASRAITASRGPVVPPVKLPEVKPIEAARPEVQIEEPPPPPTPPEESELTPAVQSKVNVSNDILDFMKRRKDVRISDIQTKFGTSADQTLDILRDFGKRGLVSGKLGRYNYTPARGEQLPSVGPVTKSVGPVRPITANGPLLKPATGPLRPPTPPGIEEITAEPPKPSTVEEAGVSPTRVKRIADLKQAIADAIDEGDKGSVKTLQGHLKSEEANAQIEKTGTTTQKKILTELDNVSNRIDELENKSERAALSNAEQTELDGAYRKLNTLEQKRDYALKPDIEKYGPRVANLRSVHAEGQLSGLTHDQLSTRAKAEFGVDSMSKLTPEQLAQFEDGLKTERLENEAEIQELEEKQLEGDLTPAEKSRLMTLMKDETGTSNMLEGLKNLVGFFSKAGPIKKGWMQSGETVLKRAGGETTAEDIRSSRTEGEKMAGGLVADYHDNIKDMSKAEAENMLAVIQGTARAVNDKVASAARIENTRLKSVMAKLGKQEVNIDPLTTDRTDRAVLSDFYTNAAKKIGEFENLGKRVRPPGENVSSIPEEIHTDIQRIKAQGGDYHTAYKVADAYFNPNRMSAAEQAVWDKLSGFEVATKLGLSVISNATQPVNIALVTGNYTLLKSVAREITNFEAVKDLALRSGSTLSSVTHESQLTAGVTPHTFGGKMLEVTGFSPVEVHNRILASMAGAEHAVAMFKKLKANPDNVYARRHLKNWLGLDPDVLTSQKKLTMDQVMTAAHNLSDKTQFRTTAMDVPYKWGSSLEARMFTLFKNFAFNQAKFMKDVVFNELKAGNLRPLIPLLTTVPLLGTLADRLKRAISGREQPTEFWDTTIGAYTTVGGVGIISDLAARAAVGKMADAIMGPIVGDAVDFVESIFRAGQSSSTKPVAKEVLRKVPVVGRPVSNRVYPLEPKKARRTWDMLPAR